MPNRGIHCQERLNTPNGDYAQLYIHVKREGVEYKVTWRFTTLAIAQECEVWIKQHLDLLPQICAENILCAPELRLDHTWHTQLAVAFEGQGWPPPPAFGGREGAPAAPTSGHQPIPPGRSQAVSNPALAATAAAAAAAAAVAGTGAVRRSQQQRESRQKWSPYSKGQAAAGARKHSSDGQRRTSPGAAGAQYGRPPRSPLGHPAADGQVPFQPTGSPQLGNLSLHHRQQGRAGSPAAAAAAHGDYGHPFAPPARLSQEGMRAHPNGLPITPGGPPSNPTYLGPWGPGSDGAAARGGGGGGEGWGWDGGSSSRGERTGFGSLRGIGAALLPNGAGGIGPAGPAIDMQYKQPVNAWGNPAGTGMPPPRMPPPGWAAGPPQQGYTPPLYHQQQGLAAAGGGGAAAHGPAAYSTMPAGMGQGGLRLHPNGLPITPGGPPSHNWPLQSLSTGAIHNGGGSGVGAAGGSSYGVLEQAGGGVGLPHVHPQTPYGSGGGGGVAAAGVPQGAAGMGFTHVDAHTPSPSAPPAEAAAMPPPGWAGGSPQLGDPSALHHRQQEVAAAAAAAATAAVAAALGLRNTPPAGMGQALPGMAPNALPTMPGGLPSNGGPLQPVGSPYGGAGGSGGGGAAAASPGAAAVRHGATDQHQVGYQAGPHAVGAGGSYGGLVSPFLPPGQQQAAGGYGTSSGAPAEEYRCTSAGASRGRGRNTDPGSDAAMQGAWPPRKDALLQLNEGKGERRSWQLRVVGWLGQGGYGTVAKVWDEASQKYRALKIQTPYEPSDTNHNSQSRAADLEAGRIALETEYAALRDVGRLTRFVVGCEAIGKLKGEGVEGLTALLLELCECDLHSYLRKHGRLSEQEAVKYLVQILEAIYCLHGCNLLHRDLKTLNVLLVKGKDGQMEARVADPGLCKYLENLNVAARTPNMGTWGSQAPESLRYGHEQGTGVDVWAIGIIWWELLVGTHPWPQLLHEPSDQRRLAMTEQLVLNMQQQWATDGLSTEAAAVLRMCLKMEASARGKVPDILRRVYALYPDSQQYGKLGAAGLPAASRQT